MKVVFYAPEGSYEKQLVAAVQGGAAAHGDEVVYRSVGSYAGVEAGADVAACAAVRASSRMVLEDYRRAGRRTLFFDKGYWGRGVYTRVAIDAWQPRALPERPDDRLAASGLSLAGWRSSEAGHPVIYCGTTQTWHDFHDLGSARAVDEMWVRWLVEACGSRPVRYRPRPAYAKKHPELCGPIEGAALSTGPLADELAAGCHVLVTIASNAAIEALAAGVKVMVMGEHPARALSSRSIEMPLAPSAERRQRLFAALAWCQWTLAEWWSGEAWSSLREDLKAEA